MLVGAWGANIASSARLISSGPPGYERGTGDGEGVRDVGEGIVDEDGREVDLVDGGGRELVCEDGGESDGKDVELEGGGGEVALVLQCSSMEASSRFGKGKGLKFRWAA